MLLHKPSSVNEHFTMLVNGTKTSDFYQSFISNNHYVVVDSIPNQQDSYPPCRAHFLHFFSRL